MQRRDHQGERREHNHLVLLETTCLALDLLIQTAHCYRPLTQLLPRSLTPLHPTAFPHIYSPTLLVQMKILSLNQPMCPVPQLPPITTTLKQMHSPLQCFTLLTKTTPPRHRLSLLVTPTWTFITLISPIRTMQTVLPPHLHLLLLSASNTTLQMLVTKEMKVR
jgi:hypothetical protein